MKAYGSLTGVKYFSVDTI